MDSNELEHPIIVKNITKKYSISHKDRAEHHSIKDAIVDVARKPLQLVDSHYGKHREVIYALDDVSFEVKKGQVMAVMGRNGSGKSTLFKILAKVTSPTSGEAIINGRVGSLLEVGAGFHPELTGRENVHFNGSILGMKKAEIYKKFDSILEFAEIDKFIDTPVKFYSSGMKVRLAFSIAIHLDTDILLMDEVLAVGDYNFKMKCFAKMEEIASTGKTILFVSHLPAHIRRICTHGILLKEGKKIFAGEVEEVIEKYLEGQEETMNEDEGLEPSSSMPELSRAEVVAIQSVESEVKLNKGRPSLSFTVNIKNISEDTVSNIRIRAVINDVTSKNNKITALSNTHNNKNSLTLKVGGSVGVKFWIPELPLKPGEYRIQIYLRDNDDEKISYDKQKDAVIFKIPSHKMYSSLIKGKAQDTGPLLIDYDCEVSQES